MKFTLSAQDLKRALNTCNEIAPAASVIADEKTGVLIRAEGETAIFMSTEENLAVRVEVPALVKEKGEALVKCSPVATAASATFVDTDDAGTQNDVQVEVTPKETLKFTGNSRFTRHNKNFPLLNVSFFVETPGFDVEQATLFPAFQFMDGLSKVSHAASNDTSKPQFNCISLTLSDNEVVFVATDGVQIAEFRKAAEVKGLRGSFILGLKFANLAVKLINPTLDTVQIYQQADTFHLKSGGTVLVGSLINTAFPEYAPYLETQKLTCAGFPTEPFRETIQSMQPTVDVKSHRLVVEADAASSTADVSTSSVQGSAGLDKEGSRLEVETPADFVLHFDSVLLQNAIRQLKGDTIDLFFTESAKSRGVVLKSDKDDDFRAFVCTLKIVE
jgi:DNA polymerase III sliding clamp (beta) subunit (PCNA family)